MEPVYQRAYEKIAFLYEKNGTVFPAELINYFQQPEEQRMITEIFAVVSKHATAKDMEKALNEEIRKVKKANLDRLAAEAKSVEQIQQLLMEKRKADSLYITITDG